MNVMGASYHLREELRWYDQAISDSTCVSVTMFRSST